MYVYIYMHVLNVFRLLGLNVFLDRMVFYFHTVVCMCVADLCGTGVFLLFFFWFLLGGVPFINLYFRSSKRDAWDMRLTRAHLPLIITLGHNINPSDR